MKSQILKFLAMSDFEPNKTLELLIGSKTRSAIYDFNVISKIEDSLYSSIDPVKIVFEGSVKEGSSLIGSDITFYVFSNKKESYDALAPLASADLKVERRNEGYIIKVEKNIFLKKGLYYYILETTDDEELIYINKFTIR